jgi:hypothetical protein
VGLLIHSQARALHIPLTAPTPCLNAADDIAAGYRVSGFVQWHSPEVFGVAALSSAF